MSCECGKPFGRVTFRIVVKDANSVDGIPFNHVETFCGLECSSKGYERIKKRLEEMECSGLEEK